jgi:hypothetical protein
MNQNQSVTDLIYCLGYPSPAIIIPDGGVACVILFALLPWVIHLVLKPFKIKVQNRYSSPENRRQYISMMHNLYSATCSLLLAFNSISSSPIGTYCFVALSFISCVNTSTIWDPVLASIISLVNFALVMSQWNVYGNLLTILLLIIYSCFGLLIALSTWFEKGSK